MTASYTKMVRWCAKQTVRSDDGFATAARHAVYRIVGKLLFYQTLARVRADVNPIEIDESATPVELQSSLQGYFAAARKIDYQALFDEDVPDRLPFSDEIADGIKRFCKCFLPLDLPSMKLDVIGRIFESLIPADEKKSLGQYFTEPPLADLIATCAIRDKDDVVFDPTCGTGGILLRAYAFLKRLGNTKHSQLLNAVWGNDVADFPTELAMINIFRQDPTDTVNFPRIFKLDIFDMKAGMTLEVAPSTPGGGVTKVQITIPQFDAVIGNPPYLRRQDIGIGQQDGEAYKNRIWADFPTFDHLSDLYVFLFEKGAEFLKPGGRLCFVTGNTWLDCEYGLELQRYFLSQPPWKQGSRSSG